MNNFIKYKIICFTVVFIIAACDPQDGKLTLVNNSSDTVFYSLSFGSDSLIDYPIKQYDGKDVYKSSAFIMPLDNHKCASMDKWEVVINSNEDSSLTIFFFSKDLIKFAGKDSIMKYQLYSHREKLKVKDLEGMNWKISYNEE